MDRNVALARKTFTHHAFGCRDEVREGIWLVCELAAPVPGIAFLHAAATSLDNYQWIEEQTGNFEGDDKQTDERCFT